MTFLQSRWVKGISGVIITGITFWLCFRKVDWSSLRQNYSEIQWFWVVLALANVVFSVYLLGLRWKILLRPKAEVSLNELFRVNIISQYWSIILPARGGEVVRAYLVSKKKKVPGGYVFGTVVVEKILDFLVFTALWLAVPGIIALEMEWGQAKRVAAVLAFLAVILLAVFIWKPDIFLRLSRKLSRIFPLHFRESLDKFFSSGLESLQILKNPFYLGGLVCFSLFIVGPQVFSNYLVFLTLGFNLSLWASLLVLVALQVSYLLPSFPGKLGVFEYVVIVCRSPFQFHHSPFSEPG